MSLNKFSSEDEGYDLKLQVGADTVKCNTADVLSTLTANSLSIDGAIVPKTVLLTGIIGDPVVAVGGGTLLHNNSIYRSEIVGGTRYSTISGGFKYQNITGVAQGPNYTVSITIQALDGINYPADGEVMNGGLSCMINDAVIAGVYTTSVEARRNGLLIQFDIHSPQIITMADANRFLTVQYSFIYSSVLA
jgi:hypothetical protein